MTDGKVLELSRRVPTGFEWSVGTGTKRSHAQIIDRRFRPIRRASWYAVADTEEEALAKALGELEIDIARAHNTSGGKLSG
jgi:hypothetical protein